MMEPRNKRTETTTAVIVYRDGDGNIVTAPQKIRTLTKEQAGKRKQGATDENILAE